MSYLPYILAVGLIAGAIVFSGSTDDTQYDTLGEQTEKPTFLTDLEADQEAIKATKGKYQRVEDDQKKVVEYVSADGVPGYQVIYTDANGTHSVGYGPEAKERTWTIEPEVIVASST